MGAAWGLSGQQEIGTDGLPVVGARALFYRANTLTPIPVYEDPDLATPITNPVVTNGMGRWPSVFINDALFYYRFRVIAPDPLTAVWHDELKVPALGPAWWPNADSPDINLNRILHVGAMFFDPDPSPREYAVRANGRTIGNPASGATERANNDCIELYQKYWNIPTLAVVGGKGSSALADWAGNKQLTLPDLRGRSPFGLDNMGNSAANRIPGALTAGQAGGASSRTLTIDHMPSHNHGGAVTGDGAHEHVYQRRSPGVVSSGSSPIEGVLPDVPTATAGGGGGTHAHGIPSQGGGQAFETVSPYIVGGWFCQL